MVSSVISRPTPLFFFFFFFSCRTDVDSDGIWVRKQGSILWHSRDSNVASTIRLPFIPFCFLLFYVTSYNLYDNKGLSTVVILKFKVLSKFFTDLTSIRRIFARPPRFASTLEFFPSLEFVILSLSLWRINIFLNQYIFQMFKYEGILDALQEFY